jgi:DNA-directed RNA polymerase specialized sigma24 family protein
MSRDDRPADPGGIVALIPALRASARDLVDGSGLEPDELVRDALALALRDWHRRPPGADLKKWLGDILRDRALGLRGPA